jgi:uncharacterized protein YdeI (YjbR/CyaY-like superfamily)
LDPVYFVSADELRAWLEKHHTTENELWIGYYKKVSGKPSITHAEAINEALCFGWIDGVRRSVDSERFVNRFTPRRPGSNWSQINIARVRELTQLGKMTAAGLAAFETRDQSRSTEYSYENRPTSLPDELESIFRENPEAWSFFESQPPSYRRTAIWFVMSAKRHETRVRRLNTLIEDSRNSRRIGLLVRPDRASTRYGSGE